MTKRALMNEMIRVGTLRGAGGTREEPNMTTLGEILQQALNDCALMLEYFNDVAYSDVVPAHTRVINMGDKRVLQVLDAWWQTAGADDARRLTRCDHRPSVYLATVGLPIMYFPIGARVEIYPRNENEGTLAVRALLSHPPLNDSEDEPEFPPALHLSIAHYAAGLMIAPHHPERGMLLMKMALEAWRNMKEKVFWGDILDQRFATDDFITPEPLPLRWWG